jgi:outer membrane protein OmpA-like peptidoglycan-associated protein
MSRKSRSTWTFLLSLVLVAGLPTLILTGDASGATGTIDAVAGNYTSPSPPVDGDAGTSTPLFIPSGIAVDPEGNYLIPNAFGRIIVLANSATNPGYPLPADCGNAQSTQCTWTVGDIYTILGEGGFEISGTPAVDTSANQAGSVSVDSEGNVLVPLGSGFNLVEVLAMSSTNPGYSIRPTCGMTYSSPCTWTTGYVYYIVGQDTGQGFTDGATALSSQLKLPTATTVDSEGNLLTLDEDGAVVVDAISSTNPGYPLASDCGGTCTWTPGDVFRIAGNYTTGSVADGTSALNWEFNTPLGISLDPTGNVLVADTGNNAVEVLAVSASNPGYVLGSGCGGTCTWTQGHVYDIQSYAPGGPTTNGGPLFTSFFSAPGGINFDSQGNLLIPEYGADVLDMIALSNCSSNCSYGLSSYTMGYKYVIAGIGNSNSDVGGTYGDGGAASSANLGGPGTAFEGHNFGTVSSYVAYDPTTGDVVLADTPLNTVRSFAAGIAPTTTTTTTTTTTMYRAPATTTTTTTTTPPTTTTTTPPVTTTTMPPKPHVHIRVNVYFMLGKSALSTDDRAQLDGVVRSVVREHFGGLSVVGYSDPLSSGLAATLLGESRASVVTKYLEQELSSLGDPGVHIGYRSGGVLRLTPYASDRVAVVTN